MVDVTIESYQANVFLTEAPQRVTVGLAAGMVRVGQGLLTRLKKNIRSDFDVRTGNMSRAAFQRVEVSPDGTSLQAVVGGDLKKAVYFRIQERGGVIVPKHAAALAIPLDAARTAGGVPKFTARQAFTTPHAFGFSHLFIRRGIVFGSKIGGGLTALFVLKPSVKLKAVGFLRKTLVENREWIRATLTASLDNSLDARGTKTR